MGRAEISSQTGAFGTVGGLTLKRFGALRGGSGTGTQPLSGYDEWDGDAKLAVRLSPSQELTVAGQRVTQRHVLRADVVEAGTDLRWEWDPETRGLAYVRYAARALRGPVEQFSATVSYQQQAEHYQRIEASAPAIEARHFDRTSSLAASVQFASPVGLRHLLTYGFDAHEDRIVSRRDDVSLATDERVTAKGVLADGARYRSLAVFLQDEIDVSARLSLNLGARLSSFLPEARVDDSATGVVVIDSNPRAVTGSARAIVRVTSAFEIVGGLGQGFRAPNIDDLTILGRTGSRFEVPNPALEPERSVTLEAGVRGRGTRVTGSATYFRTDIDGLIQRAPGIFNGETYLDTDGNGVRDGSEPLIFQRQNAGQALIQGAELEARLRLSAHWRVSGLVVRTVGTEQIAREPLRRIPPTNGRATLGWQSGGRLWADGYVVFASRQTRLAPGDLTDVRIPAGGTPGFVTLNARGGVMLGEALEITIGLENMTDRSYRTHGSGIDAAGTSAIAGINWVF